VKRIKCVTYDTPNYNIAKNTQLPRKWLKVKNPDLVEKTSFDN